MAPPPGPGQYPLTNSASTVTASRDSGSSRYGFRSIETRLPFLITVLLLLLVVGGTIGAYREIRRTAFDAGFARVAYGAQQVAAFLDAGDGAAVERLRAAAANPLLLDALQSGSEDAIGAIAFSQGPPNRGLPLELRLTDGRVVASLGQFPPGWSEARIDSMRAVPAGPGPFGFSEIRIFDEKPFLWIVASVEEDDGTRIGSLAQLLQLGEQGGPESLSQLLGPGYQIYFANTSGGPWVDASGDPIIPSWPVEAPPAGAYSRAADGVPVIASAAPSTRSPIAIIVEAPVSSVLAGPHGFLRRLTFGAIILSLFGATAVWLVTRRMTRPLRQLSDATRALRDGNRPPVIHVQRDDELGELAAAFNSMAADVHASRAALREQVAEASAARAEAENANRVKSEFLATVSHEIRTPLNAIIGYTDLLLMGVPEELKPSHRQRAERIYASSQHLLHLVEDMLDFSRLEAGRLSVEATLADPVEAIEMAISVLAPAAAEREISLRFIPPSEPVGGFVGDARRVGQILNNLIGNAIKFSPEGSVVDIGVKCDSTSNQLLFTVADEGEGIEREMHDQIFVPFVQSDRGYARTSVGVGLGLAISRELARLMGGDVTVESEPGGGATFVLWIPAAGSAGRTEELPTPGISSR